MSVALDGDRALVGATGDDDGGDNSGAAYVFSRDARLGAWTQDTKLVAPDAEAGDAFGASVALDGERALVGTYSDDRGAVGAAYVFSHETGAWLQDAKLTAADGAPGDAFGVAVALDGDRALVGATGGDGGGSAYVFDRDALAGTWAQDARLTAPAPMAGDVFGAAVALSGDRVLVGAYGDGRESGVAYVFARTGGTWVQEAEVSAGIAVPGERFGAAAALDGDGVLIGAPYTDGGGAAYASELPARPSVTSSAASGWRLLSVPVPATVADLTPLNLVGGVQSDPVCDAPTGPLTLYTAYDGGPSAPADGFTRPLTYADALTPGAGFFWYFFEDGTVTCGSGATASTIQPLPVTLAVVGDGATTDRAVTVEGRVDDDGPLYAGGNAFAEPVDLGEDALTFVTATDANGAPVPLQNTVQVYDPEAGGYVLVAPSADGGEAGGGDDLAVWQGAWIERTDAASPTYPLTLTYAASARTGGDDAGPFVGRTSGPVAAGVESSQTRVEFALTGTVEGPNGRADVYDGAAAIVIADDVETDWDAWDASKLDPVETPFALVAPVGPGRDGTEVEKASESVPQASTEIPLALRTSDGGTFTLTWSTTVIPDLWSIELVDDETGDRVDLAGQDGYVFEAGPTDDWDRRFRLTVTIPGVANEDGAVRLTVGRVSPNPTAGPATVAVTGPVGTVVQAEVYDVLGRQVMGVHDGPIAGGRLALPTDGLAPGAYVVRVRSGATVEARRFTVVR